MEQQITQQPLPRRGNSKTSRLAKILINNFPSITPPVQSRFNVYEIFSNVTETCGESDNEYVQF